MKIIALFMLCLMLIASGCTSGPLRYKTLGNNTYGTVEFTKRVTPIAKPFAAIGGMITDVGLIVIDTVITPFISVGYGIIASVGFGSFGMGNNDAVERVILSIVLVPFLMHELGYGNIDETMGFGQEATWLKNPHTTNLEVNGNSTEQLGPAYPPQGVGSADP